jgi:gluconokinase
MAQAVVLMGVAGSGKSSVGRALAEELGWEFHDGDDFMPAANVQKMASGNPLTDADRIPWLNILQALIADKLASDHSLVLACSSLKEIYRQRLRANNPNIAFVHLKGDFELIKSRLEARPGHFMKADMLQSQFETLEDPTDAISINIDQAIPAIVGDIVTQLQLTD